MPLCAICLTREANQTGSHMLSAFMIESTVGKRGEELGYHIDTEPNFDYRQNTGAEPVVEDYIFCTGCEKRMSYIEGYICADYRDKIKNSTFAQNFVDLPVEGYPGFVRESLRVNPLAFTLLIMSLLLRISLSSKLFKDFSLRGQEQEAIRGILDQALPPFEDFKVKVKLKHYLRGLNEKASLFSDFNYIIAIYDQLDDTTTSFNFAHPSYRFPYNIMIGEVLILAFFEAPSKEARFQDYLGVTDQLDVTAMLNVANQPIKTLVIEKVKWVTMIQDVKKEVVAEKMRRIRNQFIRDFIKSNRRLPTQKDWQRFIDKNFPSD